MNTQTNLHNLIESHIRHEEFMRQAQALKAMGHELKGQLRGLPLARALGYDNTESMRKTFNFEAHPFVRKDGKQWEANIADVIEHLAMKSLSRRAKSIGSL